MNYTKNKLTAREAYEIVIKDLKSGVGKRCKDYASGCFVCFVWRIIDDLKYISLMINDVKNGRRKN